MSKDAIFTMKLEPELREAFMAATRAADRPASQVVRQLMREYIEKHQHEDYRTWLERKVKKSRASMRAGKGLDDAEVDAEFAELRHQAMKVAER
ncbi:MAG: antitoxin of toxin-antitoxin stability system [Xanthomonadales bacterium]|nr:antitoxin of toxin-antitoxin stability system [Xanthomonadales bacterium]